MYYTLLRVVAAGLGALAIVLGVFGVVSLVRWLRG